MRVISGFLKGRKIDGYDIVGTRPTMDRVKESIFSSIQNNIKEATVLDLFAGSGNLGIEAISNYAKFCYFVDNNDIVIRQLNKTINNFNIMDKCKIIKDDYKKALSYFKNSNIKFDIIFVDPPYKYEIIDEIIDIVTNYDLLNNEGLLILEFQNDVLKDSYKNLLLVKNKKYSDKFVYIYKKNID